MKANFTYDDLILYHYKELPASEIDALETALCFDENLKEMHNSILEMKKMLNGERKKPSDASIRIILDYNRQSSGELETI
ncbi:MAG: hypothetical protein H6579_06860 [Chitinophagales bacterium]|nr:hypothetical protein [Chitinophagales bacterium]